jgi:hypothetical protein
VVLASDPRPSAAGGGIAGDRGPGSIGDGDDAFLFALEPEAFGEVPGLVVARRLTVRLPGGPAARVIRWFAGPRSWPSLSVARAAPLAGVRSGCMRVALVAIPVLLAAAAASADEPAPGGAELGTGLGVHMVSARTALFGGGNGAPDTSLTLTLRTGIRFARYYDLELEAEVGSTATRDTDASGALFGYRGVFNVRFAGAASRFRPFLSIGGGGETAVVSRASARREHDTIPQLLLGGGLEIGLGERWGLRIDGRELIGPGSAGHAASGDFELIFGLMWSARGTQGYVERGTIEVPAELKLKAPDRDSDGDGIPNSKDMCPITPEDPDGHDDDDGCPDLDDDQDGILEPIDRCPAQAEDLDGVDDDDGCPDPDDAGGP